ncbi:hypothetical protein [Mycolicibacterium vanbaalenii]|uniref:hypothetical protein n=1 Tax=Mycolicibacterium vanbaalenii TaxID=110539 RepID=UPI0027E2E24A|nr:hypothetical protein [Mycolicibacterium vanbaalenii]
MTRPALFTPSASDTAALEALTVGRTDLLDTLTQRIRSSARDGSRPHTLLVAPAGRARHIRCVSFSAARFPMRQQRDMFCR